MAHRLERAGDDALAPLYASRARELALERASAAAGTARFGNSRANAWSFGPASSAEADRLTATWLAEPVATADDGADAMASDAAHPASLLSRMRDAVLRADLPFTVLVEPRLFALAATGPRTILIAPGRTISDEAARRTVLHEVQGHAVPRVRAARTTEVLFALGSARGIDEQEGYALVLEDRHGFLGPHRRRELAARYAAVRAMREGASFEEVFAQLTREHALDVEGALLLAERAFRGGDGRREGLGRERVYIESYVRVRAHLGRAPGDEPTLASGQLSLDAVPALRDRAANA